MKLIKCKHSLQHYINTKPSRLCFYFSLTFTGLICKHKTGITLSDRTK